MAKLSDAERAEFLEREHEGLLDDAEMVDFIERNLINTEERAELIKRKLSVAGILTGKFALTVSNERFLETTFRRWNEILGRKVFHY